MPDDNKPAPAGASPKAKSAQDQGGDAIAELRKQIQELGAELRGEVAKVTEALGALRSETIDALGAVAEDIGNVREMAGAAIPTPKPREVGPPKRFPARVNGFQPVEAARAVHVARHQIGGHPDPDGPSEELVVGERLTLEPGIAASFKAQGFVKFVHDPDADAARA